MKKSTNSITINGHIYDATTGAKIGSRNIDGIFSAQKASVKSRVTNYQVSPAKLAVVKPQVQRTAPAHAKTQKLQSSKTLMRHVVAKSKPGNRPDVSRPFKAIAPVSGHSSVHVTTRAEVVPKHSAYQLHPQRVIRAQDVQKSAIISKFGSKHSFSGIIKASDRRPTKTQTAIGSVVIPHTAHAQLVTNHTNMFEAALERATSHQQPLMARPKNKRQSFIAKKRFSAALTAVTVLMLAGILGYSNRSVLGLKMASRQAGINAELPGYRPSGFSVSKVKASTGAVAIDYISNSDNRSFALTEKASQWDSATLRDTYVLGATKTYQTLQVGGRTVYLYGKNDASWVNGGIWYQMKTNGSLSSQQISQIASSL